MPSFALQFLFRLALGVTVGIGLTPVALAARSFHRLSCWCLLILGVAGAAVAHLSGGATEHSGLVIVLAVGLSVLACTAAALWQRGRDESARLVIFTAGLLAVIAVALATDWNRVPGGLGIWLGLADLVSSGLLLGVTMAALWLDQQTVAVLAYLALFASLVGELAAQLVSVETPYTG